MDRWLKSESVKRPHSEMLMLNEKIKTKPQPSTYPRQTIWYQKVLIYFVEGKYNEKYLQFGFIENTANNELRPQCVLCLEVLSNESMKPAKL